MSDVCGLCGVLLLNILAEGSFLDHMIENHSEALDAKLAEFIISEVDI